MTHAPGASDVGEWLPRVGSIDTISPERSALIRGLFELAAWVADRSGLPVPSVVATIDTGLSQWSWQCRVVDQVAAALDLAAVRHRTATGVRYEVETTFGPVGLRACAISTEERMALAAAHSYVGAVSPWAAGLTGSGGGRR